MENGAQEIPKKSMRFAIKLWANEVMNGHAKNGISWNKQKFPQRKNLQILFSICNLCCCCKACLLCDSAWSMSVMEDRGVSFRTSRATKRQL